MNSVPRKLTLGLMVAFGAAACGDDVTVTEQAPPPAPTPVVRSVVVSPSAATVAVGGTFQFGAAVDADAGLAGTVTWSSSNTAVASVNASGLATATQTAGQTSICATSTADATKSSCAQLTVTPAVAPVTVEIDAVTIGCDQIALRRAAAGTACNLNSPVASNDVWGEIQVQVNVNRPAGSVATGIKLDVIDVATGSTEQTATQTFSSDVAVDAEGLSAQASNQRVTFTVQTAAYDLLPNATSPTSARARSSNGNKRIRVSALGAGGSVASSAERNLFFNNVNGFHITLADSTRARIAGTNENGVPARITDTNGFLWTGGVDLTFVSLPVSYVPAQLPVVNQTVSFGGAGCGTTQRTLTGGVAAFSYTSGAPFSATTVNQYEITTASPCFATGEFPYSNAQGADGNPFILFGLGGVFGPFNTLNTPFGAVMPEYGPNQIVPALRLDNGSPSAPTVTNTPNGRTGGWMNDEVVLNGTNASATSNGTITGASTDAGIGLPSASIYTAYVCNTSTAATCAGSVPANLTATGGAVPANGVPKTSLLGFPETPNTSTTWFVVQAVDRFRNRNLSSASAIGIDLTAPTVVDNNITAGGSDPDSTIIETAGNLNVDIRSTDALSGFNPTNTGDLRVSVIRHRAGASANHIGTGTPTVTPFTVALNVAGRSGAFLNTPATPAYTAAPTSIEWNSGFFPVEAGYWVTKIQSRDRAGNRSDFFVRRFYRNNGAIPRITGLNASLTYTGGAVASFPATADDSTEVHVGEFRLAYPNTGGSLIYNRSNLYATTGGSPVIDPVWTDAMNIPASVPFSAPAFIRGIQTVDGTGALAGAGMAMASAKPTAVTGRVYNPFGATLNISSATLAPVSGAGAAGWSADFTAPILPTQVQNGSDYTTLAAPVLPSAFIRVSAGACSGTAPGPRTCADTLIIRGPASTFVNPFVGVALVEAIGGTADWRLVASTASIGQILPTGMTAATITPLFSGGFPTLDNGSFRDYRYLVSVTRSASLAAIPGTGFDYRLVGVNSTFDGLASVAWNRLF